MTKIVYAEDVNYWQTSRSSSDTWLEKAMKEIQRAGGEVLGDAYGNFGGRSAYMLGFRFAGQEYKVVWPVLESKTGNHKAAKVQAATMLYHDVKSKAVAAKVLGAKAAFLPYLMLPDGRTAAETTAPELFDILPHIVTPRLLEGEIVEE